MISSEHQRSYRMQWTVWIITVHSRIDSLLKKKTFLSFASYLISRSFIWATIPHHVLCIIYGFCNPFFQLQYSTSRLLVLNKPSIVSIHDCAYWSCLIYYIYMYVGPSDSCGRHWLAQPEWLPWQWTNCLQNTISHSWATITAELFDNVKWVILLSATQM